MFSLTNFAEIESSGRYIIDADSKSNPQLRPVKWEGVGWYSKADDGIYYRGTFATYSRIKILRNPKRKKI